MKSPIGELDTERLIMYKDKYELNVSVNGKAVREFYKDGNFFIEARNGSEYSIKLKNHSHKKIMAVFSVDGVDVLKGGKASDAQSGYIVNPYSHVVINGYRIDDNNVATFKFDDGKNSYATQVDYDFDKKKIEKVKKGELAAAKNNGIIGIRIWEEKESNFIKRWKQEQVNNLTPYRTYNPTGYQINTFTISGCPPITGFLYTGYSGPVGTVTGPVGLTACAATPQIATTNTSFSLNNQCIDSLSSDNDMQQNIMYMSSSANIGISNNQPNFILGTSWGGQIEDKILKVDFEKSDTYVDLELYYVERQELINMGIDLENNKQVFVSGWPKAFEKESYCKQSIDWRASK